jgi:hypothetical protein
VARQDADSLQPLEHPAVSLATIFPAYLLMWSAQALLP